MSDKNSLTACITAEIFVRIKSLRLLEPRPILMFGMMQFMKTFVKNRDDNDIGVLIEGATMSDQLMFIAHGLNGNKEELHIRTMIEAFLELNYRVVSYDVIHTFGESKGGRFEDATVTNYLNDLEDVIQWASTQEWYIEPFVLCGHSLGSIAVTVYAQRNPKRVKAVAPVSTVISGKLSLTTPQYVTDAKKWEENGFCITKKSNGSLVRLKWSHVEDRLKYDLLLKLDKLTMPVIMMVGSEDSSTPPGHQKLLFDKLGCLKEFHIIEGAIHTFDKPEEREQLKKIIKTWAKKL